MASSVALVKLPFNRVSIISEGERGFMDKSDFTGLIGRFRGLVAPHPFVVICTSVADGVVVLDLDLVATLLADLPNGISLHMVVELMQLLWIVSVRVVVTEVIVVVGFHSGE